MRMGSRWLWLIAGIGGALFLLIRLLSLWAEGIWYATEGYSQVFFKVIAYRVFMFVVFFCWFFLLTYGLFFWATRIAQKVPMPLRSRIFEEAEKAITDAAFNRWALAGALLVSLVAGVIASSRWTYLLLFLYGGSFGHRDPIFGHEAAFYVFRLPLIRFWVLSTLFGLTLGTIGVLLRLRYEQLIRFEDNQVEAPPFVARPLLVLASVFFLVLGLSQWLSRYGVLFSKKGVVFGAGFSDLYGTLPGIYLTVAACAGAIVWFLTRLRAPDLKVVKTAITAVLVVWLVGRILFPAALQGFVVAPDELKREKPFLTYNIGSTRFAYSLDQVQEESHPAEPTFSSADLEAHKSALLSARLWDIEQLQGLFAQVQAFRPYYSFSLPDYDRYVVGSSVRQVAVAAREIFLPPALRRWVNERLRYTHGYGLTMVSVTDFTREGMPVFLIKDIPAWQSPELKTKIRRPQIYFGEYTVYREPMQRPTPARPTAPPSREAPPQPAEGTPPTTPPAARDTGQRPSPTPPQGQQPMEPALTVADYVLVRTREKEFDYPIGDGFRETVYEGDGGVPIGSWWRRILFAARHRDPLLLLTTAIRPDSRLLMYRRILDRVQKLAPFFPYLVPDPDAYPVISQDGRILWMMDLYTTTADFPYSAPVPDPRGRLRFNYIRNAAKAVIDAYTGRTVFYLMDKKDPISQALLRAFPGLFKDFDEMPSDIKSHIRYPRLIFYIQAMLHAFYHMTDAAQFYNKEDVWEIPFENRMGESQPMLPYYILTRSPGEGKDRFLLLLPFTPLRMRNLVAWMVAHCDPDRYGQLFVYRFPKDRTVFGPQQIEARINADTTISAKLTLWNQQGSRALWGNLLILPIGDSLVYVRPLYLQSADTPLPQLKQVVVATGNGLTMSDSLLEAALSLARLSPDGRQKPTPLVAPGARSGAAELAQQLRAALDKYQAARQAGDWQTLGRYWQEVERLSRLLTEVILKENQSD
ncbi:MAG: UPF0182 family protein [Armatimonadetes bacterium]|nr:UPF0182 family protein [Armatimonadota bacterium]MDW8122567.1 UPF0182 family protein [Armatimonadota bacterium]